MPASVVPLPMLGIAIAFVPQTYISTHTHTPHTYIVVSIVVVILIEMFDPSVRGNHSSFSAGSVPCNLCLWGGVPPLTHTHTRPSLLSPQKEH